MKISRQQPTRWPTTLCLTVFAMERRRLSGEWNENMHRARRTTNSQSPIELPLDGACLLEDMAELRLGP
jgi:hypothetical protein